MNKENKLNDSKLDDVAGGKVIVPVVNSDKKNQINKDVATNKVSYTSTNNTNSNENSSTNITDLFNDKPSIV